MRSTTLALLLLISVQAVLNMGGGARGRGTSREHCAQSGSRREQGASTGDLKPHSQSTPTMDPKLLTGNSQPTHTAGTAFFKTTPDSNSTVDPTLFTESRISIPTTDPKLFNTTPHFNSTADPKLFTESPTSVPTTDPKVFNTTPHSNSTADSKLTPTESLTFPSTDPELFNITPFSKPTPDPELLNESQSVIPAANLQLLIELPDSIPTVDPKVFNKRRYRSPRVLFSAHPPDAEVGGPRVRRRTGQPRHRGVYSVCDQISNWVGNKTKAIDITGNEVTVLPDVRINNIVKKQYFFETTCYGARRPSPSGGSSCLGIDSRHWNSYCTNTHTFVLAMTSSKSLVAWRLIRINAACVCVLSRKSWRH